MIEAITVDEFISDVRQALTNQIKHYEKTGELAELVLPSIGRVNLEIDPNDPPDVRRRVMIYRVKLAEWSEFSRQQQAAYEQDRFALNNMNEFIANLLGG